MARINQDVLRECIKVALTYIGIVLVFATVFVVAVSIHDKTDRGMLGRAADYCQKRYENTFDDYCPTIIDGVPITCMVLNASKTSCSFDDPSGRDPKIIMVTHYWLVSY